jgi:hypothetical protein
VYEGGGSVDAANRRQYTRPSEAVARHPLVTFHRVRRSSVELKGGAELGSRRGSAKGGQRAAGVEATAVVAAVMVVLERVTRFGLTSVGEDGAATVADRETPGGFAVRGGGDGISSFRGA